MKLSSIILTKDYRDNWSANATFIGDGGYHQISLPESSVAEIITIAIAAFESAQSEIAASIAGIKIERPPMLAGPIIEHED